MFINKKYHLSSNRSKALHYIANLKFLLFVSFMVFFCACEKEDVKYESTTPLYPLNIGNSWSYQDTINNRPETIIEVQDIQYSYTINDIHGFSFQEYKTGSPCVLFNNDKNGNFIVYLFDNNQLVHSSVLYKKGAKKGDSWTYLSTVFTNDNYLDYDIEEQKITCIASDTIIRTSKGAFHCTGFSYHPGGFQENGDPYNTKIDYLSDNVGIVKSFHYEHENGKSWLFREQTLIDYSIKQDI